MIKVIITVAVIISFSIAILMLLVIIGAGKCKSDKEIRDELEEESRIVSSDEYKNRKGLLGWIFQNK